MNKCVCGLHRVVDKPHISLSDTLGPAKIADQDTVITKSGSGIKRNPGPRQDSG